MRLADEEIDREFAERYVADQVDKEISAWLDELAYLESSDHKAAAKFKRQKKYGAAYRAEHKEEIAAYQAAYRADPENRRRRNEYMREYMRAYRKGIRRKANDAARHIQSAAETLDKKSPHRSRTPVRGKIGHKPIKSISILREENPNVNKKTKIPLRVCHLRR